MFWVGFLFFVVLGCRGKEEVFGLGRWGVGFCKGIFEGGRLRFLIIVFVFIISLYFRGREEVWLGEVREGGC